MFGPTEDWSTATEPSTAPPLTAAPCRWPAPTVQGHRQTATYTSPRRRRPLHPGTGVPDKPLTSPSPSTATDGLTEVKLKKGATVTKDVTLTHPKCSGQPPKLRRWAGASRPATRRSTPTRRAYRNSERKPGVHARVRRWRTTCGTRWRLRANRAQGLRPGPVAEKKYARCRSPRRSAGVVTGERRRSGGGRRWRVRWVRCGGGKVWRAGAGEQAT